MEMRLAQWLLAIVSRDGMPVATGPVCLASQEPLLENRMHDLTDLCLGSNMFLDIRSDNSPCGSVPTVTGIASVNDVNLLRIPRSLLLATLLSIPVSQLQSC